jgi:hypothetical protein
MAVCWNLKIAKIQDTETKLLGAEANNKIHVRALLRLSARGAAGTWSAGRGGKTRFSVGYARGAKKMVLYGERAPR